MRSGWGPVNYPQVVGHEIVGTAIKVGKDVKDIKVDAPYHSSSGVADLIFCRSLRLGTWWASVPRAILAAPATHANNKRSLIVPKVSSAPTTVSTSAVREPGTRHTEE